MINLFISLIADSKWQDRNATIFLSSCWRPCSCFRIKQLLTTYDLTLWLSLIARFRTNFWLLIAKLRFLTKLIQIFSCCLKTWTSLHWLPFIISIWFCRFLKNTLNWEGSLCHYAATANSISCKWSCNRPLGWERAGSSPKCRWKLECLQKINSNQ